MSSCDVGRPTRIAVTTTTGRRAGDRPVDADQRGQQRDDHHDEEEQSRAARARPGDQDLPGPRRHARGVEARADHEQRRDEDDRGIAEAGEGLPAVEDPRRVQRKRRPEGHQDYREPVPEKERDDRRDDREGDPDVTHRARASWPEGLRAEAHYIRHRRVRGNTSSLGAPVRVALGPYEWRRGPVAGRPGPTSGECRPREGRRGRGVRVTERQREVGEQRLGPPGVQRQGRTLVETGLEAAEGRETQPCHGVSGCHSSIL